MASVLGLPQLSRFTAPIGQRTRDDNAQLRAMPAIGVVQQLGLVHVGLVSARQGGGRKACQVSQRRRSVQRSPQQESSSTPLSNGPTPSFTKPAHCYPPLDVQVKLVVRAGGGAASRAGHLNGQARGHLGPAHKGVGVVASAAMGGIGNSCCRKITCPAAAAFVVSKWR